MKLTRGNIQDMEAGRDMDGLIDLHIFGFDRVVESHKGGIIVPIEAIRPYYSTSISSAWKIVDHFTKDLINVQVQYLFEGSCDNGVDWACIIGEAMSEATTPALVICRAALLTTI